MIIVLESCCIILDSHRDCALWWLSCTCALSLCSESRPEQPQTGESTLVCLPKANPVAALLWSTKYFIVRKATNFEEIKMIHSAVLFMFLHGDSVICVLCNKVIEPFISFKNWTNLNDTKMIGQLMNSRRSHKEIISGWSYMKFSISDEIIGYKVCVL